MCSVLTMHRHRKNSNTHLNNLSLSNNREEGAHLASNAQVRIIFKF